MNGFINILKTPGITSSTAVSIIKKIYNIKKVGHAGTLDPGAAGVLPIMINKATKLFDYLQDDKKEYIAEFVFGIDTETLDMQGEVTAQNDVEVTEEDIIKLIPDFWGEIKQFPPRVSAISINGKKAYDLQREGVEFDVPEKTVTIYDIHFIRKTAKNSYLLKISCSKGTYIRSLCRDMAARLGTYGYVNYLLRTKSSCFNIEESYSVEELREISIDKVLVPIDKPIEHLPKIQIAAIWEANVINGVKIPYENKLDKIFRVYSKKKFLGLGRSEIDDNIQYIKVYKRFFD